MTEPTSASTKLGKIGPAADPGFDPLRMGHVDCSRLDPRNTRHPSRLPLEGIGLLLLAGVLLVGCSQDRARALADLESPDPSVQVRALEILARRPALADLPLLSRSVRGSAAEVRRAAVLAIGESRAPGAVDLLGEALDDPDDSVQRTAASTLARRPEAKARAYLMAAFVRKGPSLRSLIVRAASAAGIPPSEVMRAEAKQLWDRNVEALTHGSSGERAGAAGELGRSGDPRAFELLELHLRDESAPVVAAAGRGLGAARAPNARALLVPMLDDPSPMVREAAAEGLAELGDPLGIPALARAASSGASSSAAAARALIRLDTTGMAACEAAMEAVEPVAARILASHASRRKVSCDRSPLSRRLAAGGGGARAAIVVVHELGATELLPPVAALAQRAKESEEVRALAIRAVQALGDETQREAMNALLAPAASRGPTPDPAKDPRAQPASRLEELLQLVDAHRIATSRREKVLNGSRGADATAPRADPPDRAQLLHDRPEMRAAAATALADAPDPLARPMLEALAAEDYYLLVRESARRALETLGAPRPAP